MIRKEWGINVKNKNLLYELIELVYHCILLDSKLNQHF
jgi:hypothetical protein